jgi:hypothetical protein
VAAWQHALLWLVSLVAGIALSIGIAYLQMPEAPLALQLGIGVLMAVMIAGAVEWIGKGQREAYVAVYGGDVQRCREALAVRLRGPLRDLDTYGTAALELGVGEVSSAKARIRTMVTPFDARVPLRRCLEVHVELAEGALGQGRLAELVALPRFRMRDLERYRASLIARTGVGCPDGALLECAAGALLAQRDGEVRAFGQWLRDGREPFDANDRPADAQRGAELAALHGHAALARRLEDRAAAILRARAEDSPYRK